MTWVGSTVAGKYRVTSHIGSGGMGTVCGARHIHLDTPVALKFLSDTSNTAVERFLREAKASAALRSEHVCRVSDFGVETITELGGVKRDIPYLAMELLEGRDLAAVLKESGAVPVEIAVDFVLQACLGIAEAHAVGIVHRDLKPGNLFLTARPDGSPLIKVLDFGVAKVPVASDVSLTQTANVIGSPAYMSPEQLRSSRSVDARSDVWALGVILYELVSNRQPFVGESLTDLAVIISTDKPRPLVEAPELEAVIKRCLAKDPARRFPDVASLAEALSPFSGSRRDVAEIATRILYGTGERATVPRPAVRVDTSGETARGQESSTTMSQSTGEVTRTATRKAGLVIFSGIAAFVFAGGVTLYLMDKPVEKQPIAEPVARDPAPPADAAIVVTPVDAAVATGVLSVRITGATDATIVIDGTVEGTGDKLERDLAPGEHVVELRARGRKPIQQTVDVRAGMLSTVAIVVPAEPDKKPVIKAKAAIVVKKPPKVPDGESVQPGLGSSSEIRPGDELLVPTPSPSPACTIAERLPSGGCPERQPPKPRPPVKPLEPCAVEDRLPSGRCAK